MFKSVAWRFRSKYNLNLFVCLICRAQCWNLSSTCRPETTIAQLLTHLAYTFSEYLYDFNSTLKSLGCFHNSNLLTSDLIYQQHCICLTLGTIEQSLMKFSVTKGWLASWDLAQKWLDYAMCEAALKVKSLRIVKHHVAFRGSCCLATIHLSNKTAWIIVFMGPEIMSVPQAHGHKYLL